MKRSHSRLRTGLAVVAGAGLALALELVVVTFTYDVAQQRELYNLRDRMYPFLSESWVGDNYAPLGDPLWIGLTLGSNVVIYSVAGYVTGSVAGESSRAAVRVLGWLLVVVGFLPIGVSFLIEPLQQYNIVLAKLVDTGSAIASLLVGARVAALIQARRKRWRAV